MRTRPKEGMGRALGCRDAGTVMKSQREASGEGKRELEGSRHKTIEWPGCHCQKHMVSNPWATWVGDHEVFLAAGDGLLSAF